MALRCCCCSCLCLQEGDLERWLRARSGVLLSEDEVMLKFVQLCLALQHVHSKVGIPVASPRTADMQWDA